MPLPLRCFFNDRSLTKQTTQVCADAPGKAMISVHGTLCNGIKEGVYISATPSSLYTNRNPLFNNLFPHATI